MVIVSRLGARITNFSALLLKESIIGVKRRSSVARHPLLLSVRNDTKQWVLLSLIHNLHNRCCICKTRIVLCCILHRPNVLGNLWANGFERPQRAGKSAFGRELPLRPFSEDFWPPVQPASPGNCANPGEAACLSSGGSQSVSEGVQIQTQLPSPKPLQATPKGILRWSGHFENWLLT